MKKPPEYSSDGQVSNPLAESGTEDFSAVDMDTPTDQFGESEVVYGDDTPATTEVEVAEPAEGESTTSSLDLSSLDTALSSSTSNGNQSSGDGDGAESVTSDQPSNIQVTTVDELLSVRELVKREDPKPHSLPNGAPRMEVPVTMVIIPNGLVQRVTVSDTGSSELNASIEKALKSWKFVPISGSQNQTASFLYIITIKSD